jgi:DNA-binding CsgD family transcriptional regulator
LTLDDAVLLALVGDVMALLDIDEFRRGLLLSLLAVIPARWASLNDVAPDSVVAIAEPPIEPHWFEKFAELAHENPLYQRQVKTGDGRAYRFSDVTTEEKLRATRLYKELYVPLEVNHQIAFTLPNGSHGVLAVALSRRDRDFTDRERDFLNRARPYLIQAYRNATAYSRDNRSSPQRLERALAEAGLTQRESQVLRGVALGSSNRDIASDLGLSDRTVQKHLENAFRKLGVANRSEAATRAWELASSLDLIGDGEAPARTGSRDR